MSSLILATSTLHTSPMPLAVVINQTEASLPQSVTPLIDSCQPLRLPISDDDSGTDFGFHHNMHIMKPGLKVGFPLFLFSFDEPPLR
jgi:hypothetical protein